METLRRTYLAQLRIELRLRKCNDIPGVIDFVNEMINDYMDQGYAEDEAVDMLPSPREAARDFNQVTEENGRQSRRSNNNQVYREVAQPEVARIIEPTPVRAEPAQVAKKSTREKTGNWRHPLLIILLFPIWLPLFIVWFVLLITIWTLVVVFYVVPIATTIGGVASLALTIPSFMAGPQFGIAAIGVSFGVVGAGFLLFLLAGLFVKLGILFGKLAKILAKAFFGSSK